MKNFLRLIVIALFLIALPHALPAAERTAASDPADAAISRVEAHYRNVRDLTAHTVQKNHLAALDKTQTFIGELRIKKPGRLRIDYTNGQIILIDKNEVLFYSKKNEQEIKRTFTDLQALNIPVAFLLGAARIRDDFLVRLPDRRSPRVLELLPRQEEAVMQKLLLHTDRTGRITLLTIFDRMGNRTEIAFSAVRENTGIADSAFAFTPPKGTEIIAQ